MDAHDPLTACLALASADGAVRRRFDAALSGAHGLSLNDFVLLRALRSAPGGRLRRVDLAQRLGITASGATRLLAPLEKTGYVVRQTNPDDARVAFASLTPAGEQLADHAHDTAVEIGTDVLTSRYTADEIATLTRLLARLAPIGA
jgi:DNA-binding MarR family transcriptional regulator